MLGNSYYWSLRTACTEGYVTNASMYCLPDGVRWLQPHHPLWLHFLSFLSLRPGAGNATNKIPFCVLHHLVPVLQPCMEDVAVYLVHNLTLDVFPVWHENCSQQRTRLKRHQHLNSGSVRIIICTTKGTSTRRANAHLRLRACP